HSKKRKVANALNTYKNRASSVESASQAFVRFAEEHMQQKQARIPTPYKCALELVEEDRWDPADLAYLSMLSENNRVAMSHTTFKNKEACITMVGEHAKAARQLARNNYQQQQSFQRPPAPPIPQQGALQYGDVGNGEEASWNDHGHLNE
ncbi:hypothetical protein HDU93_004003, partial [Gonapodya sp. JEL0774]